MQPTTILLLLIAVVLAIAIALIGMAMLRPRRRRPNALLVGSPAHPAMIIHAYRPQPTEQRARIPIAPGQLAALEALVRHVPQLAASASARTLVVRFTPGVAARLSSGTATLMPALEGGVRTIALGPNGQILDHSAPVAAGVPAAAAASAVWQVLAMATAQYYLVGISKRLSAIEQQLDELQQRMRNQDMASLRNNFKRLQSTRAALAGSALTEFDMQSFVSEVDTIDRECGRIMENAAIEAERIAKRLEGMSLKANFDPAEKMREAQRRVDEHAQFAQLWAMAASSRAAAAEVRCALPTDSGVALRRLQELRGEIPRWAAAGQAFAATIKQRAGDIGALGGWWKNDHDYQEDMVKASDQVRRQFAAYQRDIERSLDAAAAQIAASGEQKAQPLHLLLEIDPEGTITAAQRLITPGAKARARRA